MGQLVVVLASGVAEAPAAALDGRLETVLVAPVVAIASCAVPVLILV